jgi:hypothetical protein
MTTTKERPVHEVRLGAVKAAIWRNETELGVRYGVTFERLYKSEQGWNSSTTFGRDELLVLAKVADLAHSYIHEQNDRSEPVPEPPPPSGQARYRQDRQRTGAR